MSIGVLYHGFGRTDIGPLAEQVFKLALDCRVLRQGRAQRVQITLHGLARGTIDRAQTQLVHAVLIDTG
ncbi:MAG: hypothetical protein DCF29_08705, partial [Alphaproteobacteria bacterium]